MADQGRADISNIGIGIKTNDGIDSLVLGPPRCSLVTDLPPFHQRTSASVQTLLLFSSHISHFAPPPPPLLCYSAVSTVT